MTEATTQVDSAMTPALSNPSGRPHEAVPTPTAAPPVRTVPVDLGIIQPRRRLGTSDLRVFPVALSGNVFGWTADETETFDVLDTYFKVGGNFVDTADSYTHGQSEELIGRWMKSRSARDDIVLATKVGKSNDNPGLTPRAIERAVEASLERLGTDRIDLLYLHIDDTEVAFERTLLGVDRLIRSGKIRYFGGSDHSGNRLYEARIAAGMLGVAPMVALQNQYSLVHRSEYERDLARVASQQKLAVMPRFALASGFLTGKYRTRADIKGHRRGSEVAKLLSKRNLRILGELDRIASLHAAPVAAVALAWLLAKPNVVAPVASARTPQQVTELSEAARVHLTRHEVAELDRISS
jgi:aryl-alcohol dehydrogenase-like predicted oxidoreductase